MARIIFTLEDGNEIEAELLADTVTIGRHKESDITLPCPSVSINHAVIKRRGGSHFVLDHGTTNGTKINGVEVDEAKLEDGDRLSFGDIPAIYHAKEAKAGKIAAEVKTTNGAPGLAPKPGKRPSYTLATSSQSAGCSGFIAILVFIIMAFVAGLCIRHYAAHPGRFLPADIMQVLRDRLSGGGPVAPVKNENKNF